MSKKSGMFFKIAGKEKQDITSILSKDLKKQYNKQVVLDAGERIVEKIGQEALQLTPKKTGNLRDSQYRRVDDEGNQVVIRIGYWSKQAPYAVRAHEVDFKPRYTTPGTQFKFLETAWKENIPFIYKELSK